MTPAEARRIDREEFEAECLTIRQRAYDQVEQRRHEARAEIAHWLGRQAPQGQFMVPFIPKAKQPQKPKKEHKHPQGAKHTINGLSLTIHEWAAHLGISRIALYGRIHRMGSLEAAVAAGGPMPKGPPPKARGVVSDIYSLSGTGGGRALQDGSKIGFYSHKVLP